MENVLKTIWPDHDFELGENQVTCPFHDDDRASAHVKIVDDTALFHCKVCDSGKNIIQLVADYMKTDNTNSGKLIQVLTDGISLFDWKKFELNLSNSEKAKALLTSLGINDKVKKDLKIGFTGTGISYPITIGETIVDVRTYNPVRVPKVRSMPGAVTGIVYPEIAFNETTVVLVEGEKDMAILRSHGINAATVIGGAMSKPNKTPEWFNNKNVVIVYDNDQAGRDGANNVAHYLLSNKKISVNIRLGDISSLVSGDKEDSADHFINGGTRETYVKMLKQATPVSLADVQPKSSDNDKLLRVTLREADKHIGKKLISRVQVASVFDSSFTIPASAVVKNSKKTKTWAFDPSENVEDILALVDNSRGDLGLGYALLPNSANPTVTVSDERRPIYKVVIASTTEDIAGTGEQQTEHLAYVVGQPLSSGKDYEIKYKLIPDPKKGNKSVALITDAVDLSTKAYDLVIDQSIKDSLDKANKLSYDKLVENAQGVIGANFNKKLVGLTDLTFHSGLEFNFGNWKNVQGTIDSLTVSDTGFGKSVTSQGLLKEYGRGARVSLAGSAATPAGLLGGSKAIGNSYQTTAGVIPRNHKGAVFFEELAKNNGSIMKDMTDVRTSGKVEIARVSGKITLPANVRTGWFSNPKAGKDGINKSVDAYPNGVEIIQDLLGAREDIGRYDLIAVLGQREDVPEDPNWTPVRYLSQEDMRNKLKWVWSRTADQIVFAKGVEDYIMQKKVGELNDLFESDIQIFGRKTWLKLARTSIAMAGYRGSHTDDYNSILVKSGDVDAAVDLFKSLYASETFRLDHYVKAERAYTVVNDTDIKILSGIFATNGQILTQLELVSEIQTNELRTVSGLTQDDFSQTISKLIIHKLIRNIKGKIVPTEKFRKAIGKASRKPLMPPTVEEEAANA